MPQTTLNFYQNEDGSVPVRDWLAGLRRRDKRAYAKCVDKLNLLAEHGHELRRPHADYLRDGIFELRARKGNVHYRVLYFFNGQQVAVLEHALTKEGKIPPLAINLAVERKAAVERDPEKHICEEEFEDGED